MRVDFSYVGCTHKGQPHKTVTTQFDIPRKGHIKNVPVDDPNRHQGEDKKKKYQRYDLFEFVVDFQ